MSESTAKNVWNTLQTFGQIGDEFKAEAKSSSEESGMW